MKERPTCVRFDEDGSNDPLGAAHLTQCDDCLAYRRIARAIPLMYAAEVPSEGWEERILKQIEKREANRRSGDRQALFISGCRKRTG